MSEDSCIGNANCVLKPLSMSDLERMLGKEARVVIACLAYDEKVGPFVYLPLSYLGRG